MSGTGAPPPLCGLANFGDTCFVNAALQILSVLCVTLPRFAAALQAAASAGVVPIRVVRDAITAMARQPGGVFRPRGVVAMVRGLSATLFPSGDADAGELVAALVDMTASFHGASFGRCLETKTCMTCQVSSSTIQDTVTAVHLPLVSGELAVDLARFGLPELLTGAERYACSNCKLGDAVSTNKFEPGELVFLQLGRYVPERITGLDGASTIVYVRRGDSVDFPEYLAIHGETYRRVASIQYHPTKRHYTTCIPYGASWAEIDDAVVNYNVEFDGTAASVLVYVVS